MIRKDQAETHQKKLQEMYQEVLRENLLQDIKKV